MARRPGFYGRRPRAAHHEAGHYLARLYFGHSFDEAVVRSVAECMAGPFTDQRGREVNCEGLVMGYDVSSPALSAEAVRAFKGLPAERDAFARQQTMAAEISLIEALAGIVAEARHRKVNRTNVILAGGDGDWAEAKAVAERWFPASKAFVLAEDRAAALVQSPAGWRAVEGMAARLLADGVMDCDTAEGIFAVAYGHPVPKFGSWTDRWPPTLARLRGRPDWHGRIQMVVATLRLGGSAMAGRRRSERAMRAAVARSPGRPGVARREDRRRFWASTAAGLSSEDAAVGAGVSQPVGSRWFREAGGMPPKTHAPSSKPPSERSL